MRDAFRSHLQVCLHQVKWNMRRKEFDNFARFRIMQRLRRLRLASAKGLRDPENVTMVFILSSLAFSSPRIMPLSKRSKSKIAARAAQWPQVYLLGPDRCKERSLVCVPAIGQVASQRWSVASDSLFQKISIAAGVAPCQRFFPVCACHFRSQIMGDCSKAGLAFCFCRPSRLTAGKEDRSCVINMSSTPTITLAPPQEPAWEPIETFSSSNIQFANQCEAWVPKCRDYRGASTCMTRRRANSFKFKNIVPQLASMSQETDAETWGSLTGAKLSPCGRSKGLGWFTGSLDFKLFTTWMPWKSGFWPTKYTLPQTGKAASALPERRGCFPLSHCWTIRYGRLQGKSRTRIFVWEWPILGLVWMYIWRYKVSGHRTHIQVDIIWTCDQEKWKASKKLGDAHPLHTIGKSLPQTLRLKARRLAESLPQSLS